MVAGQSNSANHGEEKCTSQTGRVASFDGLTWQIANDPQPGASGNGGSFIPFLAMPLLKHVICPLELLPAVLRNKHTRVVAKGLNISESSDD